MYCGPSGWYRILECYAKASPLVYNCVAGFLEGKTIKFCWKLECYGRKSSRCYYTVYGMTVVNAYVMAVRVRRYGS